MSDSPTPDAPGMRMVKLTIQDDPPDLPRIAWWLVVGPQPEREAYGVIQLSWILNKHDVRREAYSWYLHERTKSPFNSAAHYMRVIANGEGVTRDEALADMASAWTQLLGHGESGRTPS